MKTTTSVNSIKRKLHPITILFRGVLLLFLLVFLWCMYVFWLINVDKNKPLQPADAAIILGAALWNDQPSPALRERLNKAVTIHEEGVVETFILSGGYGGLSSTQSEAAGMKAFLFERGIQEQRMKLEEQSTSTYENLLFSKSITEDEQLNSFIIITHDFHAQRAREIAEFLNYPNVQVIGIKTDVLNEAYYQTREVLAYTKWKLDQILLMLGLPSIKL